MKVTQSCPTLCDPMDYTTHGILQARILEWVAFPFSRGLFPTQGSNSGLPHCRWILYQLSHKGSPGILEWVAHPFSSRSSRPRNRTRVSCIAGRRATREAQEYWRGQPIPSPADLPDPGIKPGSSALQADSLPTIRSLGWEDPVETGMATHFSILAWEFPWTEEPGRLQSRG